MICSDGSGYGVLVYQLIDPDLGPVFTKEPLDGTDLTCSFYFPGLDLLTANKFNVDQPRDSKGRWTPASMAKGTGRTPSAAGQAAMVHAALGKKADVSSHVDAIHTLRSRGTDLSKEEITAHVNRLGRHLNKAQVHDVARATGVEVAKTKKDTLAAIHEHLSSRTATSTQQGGAKPYTPVNPDLHKASEIEIHKHFAAIKAQAQTYPKESRENAKEFLDKVESHRGKSYLHSLATDHGVPTAVNPGGKGMDSAPPLVIRNRILDKLFPTQASSQTPAAAAPVQPTAGTLSPTVPNSHAELAQATAGKQGFTGPFQRGPYTVVRHDDSGHTIEAEAGSHSGRFAVKDPSNVVHSRHDTAEAAVAAIQGVNRIGTSQGMVDKELRDRAVQAGKGTDKEPWRMSLPEYLASKGVQPAGVHEHFGPGQYGSARGAERRSMDATMDAARAASHAATHEWAKSVIEAYRRGEPVPSQHLHGMHTADAVRKIDAERQRPYNRTLSEHLDVARQQHREYVATRTGPYHQSEKEYLAFEKRRHAKDVGAALREGRAVPERVLKDYPELQKKHGRGAGFSK